MDNIANATADLRLETFPLGLISTRHPLKRSCSFVAKEPQDVSLTIAAAENSTLPTASDMTLLFGLVHYSQLGGLKDKTFELTRYRICQLIGLQPANENYRRIMSACTIWETTAFKLERTWNEEGGDLKLSREFKVLQTRRGPKGEVIITWTNAFWNALKSGSWATTDLSKAIQFRPTTRQLYCFVCGRLRETPRYEVEARQLAHQHLGLSPRMPLGRMLQETRSCIEEIEKVGALPPLAPKERIKRQEPGVWLVRFEQSLRETKAAGGIRSSPLAAGPCVEAGKPEL